MNKNKHQHFNKCMYNLQYILKCMFSAELNYTVWVIKLKNYKYDVVVGIISVGVLGAPAIVKVKPGSCITRTYTLLFCTYTALFVHFAHKWSIFFLQKQNKNKLMELTLTWHGLTVDQE